jgi:hypothetical protein
MYIYVYINICICTYVYVYVFCVLSGSVVALRIDPSESQLMQYFDVPQDALPHITIADMRDPYRLVRYDYSQFIADSARERERGQGGKGKGGRGVGGGGQTRQGDGDSDSDVHTSIDEEARQPYREAHMAAFVQRFMDGRLTPTYKSEAIPRAEDSDEDRIGRNGDDGGDENGDNEAEDVAPSIRLPAPIVELFGSTFASVVMHDTQRDHFV